ncbi:HD domain-containing protein [Candidatus Falkowbacteria bacterium]|nr:HD domain-containing protein [Candidatus Falkowbacteria bacterium]
MDYKDRIYGEVEISEPVILELLASPSLQRLKGVDQYGYLPGYGSVPGGGFPGGQITRFEHSVGVFLLLRKYSAPLPEQIAGLLHDVSHTVFSHGTDYALRDVVDAAKQSHQDDVFGLFVKNSDIPKILEKYGLNVDQILDDKNFPLKEKKLPDLCADRIDYFLRDGMDIGVIDNKTAENFLNQLQAENDIWFFDNLEIAKECVKVFCTLNNEYYASFSPARMFASVGGCVKYALEKGYLEKADLFTTDDEAVAKIKNHLDDEKLKLLFARMNNEIGAENNPADFDQRVLCKSRAIDPFFRDGEKLKRVSEVDTTWAAALPEELKPKEYFIKFEK